LRSARIQASGDSNAPGLPQTNGALLQRPKGNTTNAALRTLKRIIGVALLSGGVAVSGLELAAGTAQALPPGCDVPYGC
jgi:hypothetical protein